MAIIDEKNIRFVENKEPLSNHSITKAVITGYPEHVKIDTYGSTRRAHTDEVSQTIALSKELLEELCKKYC